MEAGAVGEAAGNLRVPMAVTTRKGHAASVRRQSRQRLRSDRRYRRNRCVPFYRQPVRVGSAAPGAACRSPTMAGACIGSGPEFAGCTRCVGDAAPYNTPSILQQYPKKMQSLFSETAFFYRPNREKRALPVRFFCSGRRGRSGQKSADASVRS